jgi:MoxR-like ATPase
MMAGKLQNTTGMEIDFFDPIIRLLDTKGKRNYQPKSSQDIEVLKNRLLQSGKRYGFNYDIRDDGTSVAILNVEGVATTMIPQNDWHKIFADLASDVELRQKLDQVFRENNEDKKAVLIDELRAFNENSNLLTKPAAIAIGTMLSSWDPQTYVRAVSLNDRKEIIKAFQLGKIEDSETYGHQIINSYTFVLKFNERFGLHLSAVELSYFLYMDMREVWQPGKVKKKREVTIQGAFGGSGKIFAGNKASESGQTTLNLEASSIQTKLQIDEETKKQICASLNSGCHIIVTGPVGTGKTTFAEDVSRRAIESKYCDGYILTTASSDWTTFDTIGGYMPTVDQKLRFEPGKFLEAIKSNKWLIIDEVNRADIDKAFGQLLTVLSGQDVELSFRDENGRSIKIKNSAEPRCSYDEANATYLIGKDWRIIATMNIYDMNFLFEMSYAFMRRFAFVYMDLPANFAAIIGAWCSERKLSVDTAKRLTSLVHIAERKMGPAIIKDMADFLAKRGDGERELGEAIIGYIIPQLEGLERDRVKKAWNQIGAVFENKLIPNMVIKPILAEIIGTELSDISPPEKIQP